MAVAASRKRFWKAFDDESGLSCADTVEGQALVTLARRRGSCRGLPPQVIANEVAALRELKSMVAYNTEFIVAAFNAIAHPDWWVWDTIKKCATDDDDVTLWSAETLCSKLGSRLTSTVGELPFVEAVVARLRAWREMESNGGTRDKEIEYLVAYRNRNEAWTYYRLCAIKFDTLADYHEGLRGINAVTLPVRMSHIDWRML